MKEVTDAKQAAVLELLAETGNITRSCALAGVARASYYNWLDDPEFDKLRAMAFEAYGDLVDEEMHARGIEGWDEPQFGRVSQFEEGIVGYVRKKSDSVLLALARGVRPDKYGKQRFEHTGKDGQPLVADLSKLSEEELVAYRMLVAKVTGGTEKES